MATAAFGPALETALKQPLQGGKLTLLKDRLIWPSFFCCDCGGGYFGVAKDPVAVLIVNPIRACTGDNVNADCSKSWSSFSTIVSWSIDWGDGNVSPCAGANVNHPAGGYAIPATYTITLTVTDMLGATGQDSQQVEIIDCAAVELGLFAGCGGSGIWYSGDAGISWSERSGGALEGVEIYDLKVHPFTLGSEKNELWAATVNGLYKSIDSGESWRLITLSEPEGGVGEPTAAAIVCSTVSEKEVYVLTYVTAPSNRVWLYRTTNGGASWTYQRLTTPAYLFGVSYASEGHVYQRYPAATWTDRDRSYEGSVIYWESNNPTVYKAHTKPAANGGGLYRWDPFAWTLIGANRECPVDMAVRANGDLALLEGGCCKLTWPPSCGANPYVRIYGTNEALKNTIVLPVLADVTRYVYITEYDGELYVSRQAVYNADHALLRYDESSATWIAEWVPGDNLYANSFAEYDGELYASIVEGYGSALYSKKLLCRDAFGNWDWDTVEAAGKIYRARIFGGKLYVLIGKGGAKIQERVGTAYVDITGALTVGNVEDFVLYDGKWFAVTHSPGGGCTYFYRWDASTNTWVQEKQGNLAADSGYQFVAKHFAEEPNVGFTISSTGRTHLISMSANGQYIYVGLLDGSANPIIMRITYDLSETTAIYAAAGTWGGVRADYNEAARVWAFGDFGGGNKVQVSDDWGDTWTNITGGSWVAGEMVRPVLPSIYDSADIVAILNVGTVDPESWRSGDAGTTWAKTGDLAFACHCGERDWIEDMNIFVGRLAAGASHLQFSPNNGAGWLERSGGITPNDAPITALQVVS